MSSHKRAAPMDVDVAYGAGASRRRLNRIGNTPLVSIRFTIDGVPRTVRLKLEGKNPAGSCKDRAAHWMVTDLVRRGALTRDSIIVESTSGNLGVALAEACRQLQVGFLAVVDPTITVENLRRIEARGGRVECVHDRDAHGSYLPARLRRLRELCGASHRFVWTNQYSNWMNPLAHYHGTAPEILRQAGGSVDAMFVPVSTGGTLAGIARYFHEFSPKTRVVGVDVPGSMIFAAPSATRLLTGIGASRRSDFLTVNHYDEFIIVKDADAVLFCRALHAQTGLKVGGSSGAALAACAEFLQRNATARDVTCVCPDGGEHYASSIYDDQWLVTHGVALTGREVLVPAIDVDPSFSADIQRSDAVVGGAQPPGPAEHLVS